MVNSWCTVRETLSYVRTCQDWLQTHPTQWTTTTIPIRILFEQTWYKCRTVAKPVTSAAAHHMFPNIIWYGCICCAEYSNATVADRRSQWHWPLYITRPNLDCAVTQATVNNALSGRANELMSCISYNTSLLFCYEVSFTSLLLFVALHQACQTEGPPRATWVTFVLSWGPHTTTNCCFSVNDARLSSLNYKNCNFGR